MLSIKTQSDFSGIYACTPYADNPFYQAALFAQAYHETGNFKSNLAVNYHNLYGMRPSTMREKFYSDTVSLGSGLYATYDDETGTMSLLDRIDLDEYNGVPIPTSPEMVPVYMSAVVAKGYATDPLYLSKWVNLFNQLHPEMPINQNEVDESSNFFGISLGNMAVPVVLGALAVWLFRKPIFRFFKRIF